MTKQDVILNYLHCAAGERTAAARQSILTEMAADPYAKGCKQYLRYVKDPSYNFYMTPKTCPEPGTSTPDRFKDNFLAMMSILSQMSQRILSGHKLQNAVAYYLGGVDATTRLLFSYAIEHKLPGGIGRTLINKVWPGLIYKQPYGGVASWDAIKAEKFPWESGMMVQRKEDGMTLMIDYVAGTARTRQGQDVTKQMSRYLNPLFIMFWNTDLVGHYEMMLYEEDFTCLMPREEANGVFNALFQSEREINPRRIVLVALDMIEHDVFYGFKKGTTCAQDRYDRMVHMTYDYDSAKSDERKWPEVMHVGLWYAYSLEEARAIAQREIANGGEGAVIKDPEGIWKSTKMTSQMKMKNEFECTLMIVGRQPHAKNPEWVGSLLLESVDGKIKTKAGSGLNEDPESELDRRNIHCTNFMDGQLAEIRAEKITKKNALSLPRIVELRHDKERADTYEEVVGAYNDSTAVNNC